MSLSSSSSSTSVRGPDQTDCSNPRTEGSNPRTEGSNPRTEGSNPRTKTFNVDRTDGLRPSASAPFEPSEPSCSYSIPPSCSIPPYAHEQEWMFRFINKQHLLFPNFTTWRSTFFSWKKSFLSFGDGSDLNHFDSTDHCVGAHREGNNSYLNRIEKMIVDLLVSINMLSFADQASCNDMIESILQLLIIELQPSPIAATNLIHKMIKLIATVPSILSTALLLVNEYNANSNVLLPHFYKEDNKKSPMIESLKQISLLRLFGFYSVVNAMSMNDRNQFPEPSQQWMVRRLGAWLNRSVTAMVNQVFEDAE